MLCVDATGDYKPFTYKSPADGCFIGLNVEMGERLAKALGVKLEIVPTAWSTLMQDSTADRYDVAMSGVSVTLERQKRAFHSIPYQRDDKASVTRYENQLRYQTLMQIGQPNVHAVVNPGDTSEEFTHEHLKQAQIRVYPDNVIVFDKIVADRADLMMIDAVGAKLQQKLRLELCAVYLEAPFDFPEGACPLPRGVVFESFVDQ